MTSVPLENHIKNPFHSFHTRVRAAMSDFITLDFIALLLAVEFQCCIWVRLWFGFVFISVVNKKSPGKWPNTIKLASPPAWILSQRVLPWTWHILSALRAQSRGPTQGWPLVYIKQVQPPSATIPKRRSVHLRHEVKLGKKSTLEKCLSFTLLDELHLHWWDIWGHSRSPCVAGGRRKLLFYIRCSAQERFRDLYFTGCFHCNWPQLLL